MLLTTQEAKKTFYPTPKELIRELLKDIVLSQKATILEPSAGKGDIAQYLKNENPYADLDCIEIDNNLRHILKGNEFKVIHDNFLTYPHYKKYNLIAMNPPFDTGDIHLLKAIQMQEVWGGKIACILNSQTIKNPYSKTRQELIKKLNQHQAQIRYKQNAFTNAERNTNVEIALINIDIVKEDEPSEIYDRMKKAHQQTEQHQEENCTALNFGDYVEALINEYTIEVSATIDFIAQYQRLAKHIQHTKGSYNRPIIDLKLASETYTYNEFNINNYLKDVRSKYWYVLFNKEEFKNRLTSKMREKYIGMIDNLKNFEFNQFNIKEIFLDIQQTTLTGIQDSILTLFDTLSYQHSYYPECTQNIHLYNGWKTNKAHMVNTKKVIVYTNGTTSSWTNKFKFDHYLQNTISDLEKAFNYLNNGDTSTPINIDKVLTIAENKQNNKNIEFKYFYATFYKKGTMHLVWKDETKELVKRLNIYAAQKKNWLPPNYGKKQYNDMMPEEQQVIKDFQGENEYNKIMLNPNKYIYKENIDLLLLDDKNC